jgi:hypothetical protein
MRHRRGLVCRPESTARAEASNFVQLQSTDQRRNGQMDDGRIAIRPYTLANGKSEAV